MLVWLLSQWAVPLASRLVGRKPPSNQPQVTPRAFSRLPILVLVKYAVSLEEQSSNAGSGSLIIVPSRISALVDTPAVTLIAVEPGGISACDVSPVTRLIAPGVEGPNVVPKKLSSRA